MSQHLTISDFGKICRICLEQAGNMVSLYSFDIMGMIEACTPVYDVQHSKLPQQICEQCYGLLATAFNFKQRCEISAEILCRILIKEESPNNNLTHQLKLINVSSLKKIRLSNSNLLQTTNLPFLSSPQSTPAIVLTTPVTESFESDHNIGTEEEEEDWPEQSPGKTEQVRIDSDENTLRKRSLAEYLVKKYNIYDLTCNICQKTLSAHNSLIRHMKTHDSDRKFKYHCAVCNKGFFETGNLNKHLNRHNGNARYKCEQCQKSFYELSALAVHYRRKHNAKPHKCPQCSMQYYHPLQLKQHETTHEKKVFKCEYCGKVLHTLNSLKYHRVRHSTERPFACSLCDKKFKLKFTLTKHQTLCHSATPPRVMCNICGKLVTALGPHLISHNKDIHKCTECPRQYTSKYILAQHVKEKHRNANKQKPFKHFCSVCEKGFYSTHALKYHTSVHTGERPYKCHLCAKTYITPGALHEHIRIAHKDLRPHVCDVCKKAFHTKIILNNHMRTHTGERPFACTVCAKTFGFKSALRTHMKIHSN